MKIQNLKQHEFKYIGVRADATTDRIAEKVGARSAGSTSAAQAMDGRGCVKTQNRLHEIVFRLRQFSVETSGLPTGRHRLISHLTASRGVFDGDSWGETVAEFSHSLGQERPLQQTLVISFCGYEK